MTPDIGGVGKPGASHKRLDCLGGWNRWCVVSSIAQLTHAWETGLFLDAAPVVRNPIALLFLGDWGCPMGWSSRPIDHVFRPC